MPTPSASSAWASDVAVMDFPLPDSPAIATTVRRPSPSAKSAASRCRFQSIRAEFESAVCQCIHAGILHSNHSASGATNGCKTISELFRFAEPGNEPGPSGFWPDALPCSPAGIPAAKIFSKIKRFPSKAGRQIFAETLQLKCSPRRHSARQKFFPRRASVFANFVSRSLALLCSTT